MEEIAQTASVLDRDQDSKIEESLETILSEIEPGYQVSISRIQPGYAKGHLDTITVHPDRPISLNYLRDTWGGEVLRLRICDPKTKRYLRGVDVEINAPPRNWGRRQRHPDELDERPAPPQPQTAIVPASNPSEQMYLGMLGILQESAAQNMNLVTTALQHRERQTERDTDPVSQIVSLAETIKTLQDLFPQRDSDTDEDNGFSGAILEMLKMFNNRAASPKQPGKPLYQPVPQSPPPRRPRPNPPVQALEPSHPESLPASSSQTEPNPKPVPIPVTSEPSPVEDDDPLTPRELATGLAELSASEIAETVELAFAAMSEEKRQEMFTELMGVGFQGADETEIETASDVSHSEEMMQ